MKHVKNMCVHKKSLFLPSSYLFSLDIVLLILDTDMNISIWISGRKSFSFLREIVNYFLPLGSQFSYDSHG